MEECPHSQLATVREPRRSPSTTARAPTRGATPPLRRAASTSPIGARPRVFPRQEAAPRRPLDLESRVWLERLHGAEPTRGSAVAELYERLRREAAFHIRHRVRNRAELPQGRHRRARHGGGRRRADGAPTQARRLSWREPVLTRARRFAALEAPVSIRRRVGRERFGVAADPELALGVPDPACSAQELLETRELLQRVSDIVANQLTNRQRTILIATAVQRRHSPDARLPAPHDPRRDLQDASRRSSQAQGQPRRGLTRATARPRVKQRRKTARAADAMGI